MRKKLPIAVLLLIICVVYSLGALDSAKSKILTPVQQEYAYITLDNMEAEYHSANKIVIVKGSIKNVSKVVLRGYISLHILNSNGSRLYTAEMAVKDHQPIVGGEIVSFDTVLNVSNVNGASHISADFTWD